MVFGDTVTVFRQQGALSWEQSWNRTLMAGLCLSWHTRIVYDKLVVAVVCMCVCMHLLHHLNYAAISQPVIQPASQPVSQPASRVQTGWSSSLVSRVNRSGSANRPQSNHITTTQHPAIYRAAYGCLQGGKRKEWWRQSSKEEGRRQGQLVGWRGQRTKEKKSREGREDKKRAGERDEVLLKR